MKSVVLGLVIVLGFAGIAGATDHVRRERVVVERVIEQPKYVERVVERVVEYPEVRNLRIIEKVVVDDYNRQRVVQRVEKVQRVREVEKVVRQKNVQKSRSGGLVGRLLGR